VQARLAEILNAIYEADFWTTPTVSGRDGIAIAHLPLWLESLSGSGQLHRGRRHQRILDHIDQMADEILEVRIADPIS